MTSFEDLAPTRIPSRSLRRCMGVLLGRLSETVRGFELVSELAGDDSFSSFCSDAAAARRRAAERLAGAIGDQDGHPLVRLQGRLQRAWIRFVASAGDATLADELDRMDGALEKSIRRTLLSGATGGDKDAHALFVDLRSAVEQCRREILSRRADLDWGNGALVPPRRQRRRGSAADEETSEPVAKPQRRLPDVAAVSEEGDEIDLEQVAGESPVVLTFISKLNRGSRRRLEGFNRRLPEFAVRDTRVVGVAKARPQQVQRVAESKDLEMPLLADPDGELAEAVDAVDAAGRPINSTMLIDRDREVLFVSLSAGRESHAAKILEAVDRYRRWFPKKMGVPGDAR